MFQNTIRKILSHIPNVKNVSDDVLVFGKPENDHAEELKILTLNASKCAFLKKKKKLTFFGMVFSSAGIRPDLEKVQAILQAGTPSSPREVPVGNDHLHWSVSC